MGEVIAVISGKGGTGKTTVLSGSRPRKSDNCCEKI